MSYSSEVLADTPIVYYRMNDASGNPQDSSGNALHITGSTGAGSVAYGEASPITSDPAAASIRFFPDETFTRPDDPLLDLGDVVTMECWFKNNLLGNGGVIIDKGANAYEMLLWTDNKYNLSKGGVGEIAESSVIDLNWHHAAITKNGASYFIYIDGVEDTTDVLGNLTLTNATDQLCIGNVAGTGFGISGWLAELAIYPTALSQERVLAHYEAATAETQSFYVTRRRTVGAR